TSHSKPTPVASSTRLVASDSSGPTPSPGINVTLYVIGPSCRCPPMLAERAALSRCLLGRLGPRYEIDRSEPVTTLKGLEDVVAAQTAISDIDGKLGKLWYVGYSIDDLAENATFEEVVFLLHNLRLPTQPELEAITEQMVNDREPGDFIVGLMPTLAEQTSPMSMLRTTVSA